MRHTCEPVVGRVDGQEIRINRLDVGAVSGRKHLAESGEAFGVFLERIDLVATSQRSERALHAIDMNREGTDFAFVAHESADVRRLVAWRRRGIYDDCVVANWRR